MVCLCKPFLSGRENFSGTSFRRDWLHALKFCRICGGNCFAAGLNIVRIKPLHGIGNSPQLYNFISKKLRYFHSRRAGADQKDPDSDCRRQRGGRDAGYAFSTFRLRKICSGRAGYLRTCGYEPSAVLLYQHAWPEKNFYNLGLPESHQSWN